MSTLFEFQTKFESENLFNGWVIESGFSGRTGHWLNHGKEHCLVGMKGNPKDLNRGLDSDVIVAEVRATSHKPDEIYGMIERYVQV